MLYQCFYLRIVLLFLALNYSLSAVQKPITTVAAVQLHSEHAGNFQKMHELVKEAKMRGADLAIFPEESLFGWLNSDVFLKAAPIPGKYSDAFAAIAKSENIWLAVGLGERGPKADSAKEGVHYAYNAGILINPEGQIVLHHRQVDVIKNAFDPETCQQILNQNQASYLPGNLADITIANTPFGRTAILVCADAYDYGSAESLHTPKQLSPDFVIVFWGITASSKQECGSQGCRPLDYTVAAARYLGNPFVIGVNATGPRNYGRFLPSEYCGMSAYSTPSGEIFEAVESFEELVLFQIDKPFDDYVQELAPTNIRSVSLIIK